MATRSSFLPQLSLAKNGNDNSSILPTYNDTSRYATLHDHSSEYDLDELSPRAEDGLLPSEFRDPNSPPYNAPSSKFSSNRKPTGALNRRPSNSSLGSASKTRPAGERVLFSGPPPPIAVSRVLSRDEEQQRGYDQYEDDEDSTTGLAASWLPGSARRAISSVMWDRGENRSTHDRGEKAVAFDRNSVWRSLARRERAVVAEVQRFLQVQEGSLAGASNDGDRLAREQGAKSPDTASFSDAGSVTPTGMGAASMVSSRHPGRSVTFLEPVARAGPGGEVIPVRQPRQKRLGITGARKGIARSMAELANLKAEEDASLLAALSIRKQALARLRNLTTRRDGIADELNALETDEEEPLGREIEDLENEHRGVSTEIDELEERLAALKSRRRHLEGRLDDVRNRREAGLSGYKNALKEAEDTVKGFLTRPPVRPLDVEALAENTKAADQPSSPGGVEFMRLRPERRTMDMAREWWEAEVDILEKRKAEVDIERVALEAGGEVWNEVVNLVLDFEADLRRQMSPRDDRPGSELDIQGKGKERELTPAERLKLQYDKINAVIVSLEQRLGAAEEKGWNLLIAAIGAELEAFREAARMNREMLTAAGVAVDEAPSAVPGAGNVARVDSGTTTGSHNSFHTSVESDNEVPPELLATHDEEHNVNEQSRDEEHQGAVAAGRGSSFEREDSENEVPHEFLVEQPGTMRS
ncbi:hypothetical protein M406DRAFT_291812 [Cryphonectria parasitica EP155]|uniref:Autophagy-related protein 28 n=1 Tax=Cryphonectria parasitica (strain ATCC 38755 / EP155) TaxID=660469 RepID=A0A9P5CP04_CRYP1|nr:uncharacterized protein M406DRAFT_291812 [Cryphonectria parasitica EP155]KAF3764661.1 hypothetical protein M406DRAFT_291812 [Cryphonectria parasitica EP155]